MSFILHATTVRARDLACMACILEEMSGMPGITYRNELKLPSFLSISVRSASTGDSSHSGAKLRDWANRQAEAGCYSWAVLSSNDSKTR